MRRSLLFLGLVGSAAAVSWGQSGWEGARSDRRGDSESKITRSINGRDVPIETVQDKLIEESAGRRVTERIVTRFGPDGRPGQVERERVETEKASNGEERTVRTLTRNEAGGGGQQQVVERSTGVTTPGSTKGSSKSVTRVQRPDLNGRFDTVQVEETDFVPSATGSSQVTTVSARDANGRFAETRRTVVETTSSASGDASISMAEYAKSGQDMLLVRQEVRRTAKASTRTEVDVYEPALPGKTASGGPKLTRRQMIDKSSVGGGVVEDVRVQLADSEGRLGPARAAERRVCSGDCGGPVSR